MSFWNKKVPPVQELDQMQAHTKELAEFAAKTLGTFYRDLISEGIPARLAEGMYVEFGREIMDLPTPEIINNHYHTHNHGTQPPDL